MKKNYLYIPVLGLSIFMSACRKDGNQVPSNQNNLNLSANLSAQNAANQTINNGLVGYYPLLGNANDSTSYANNGTLRDFNSNGGGLGLPVLTTDKFGQQNSAYLFNGLSDYITLPNNPLLYNTIPDSSLTNYQGVTQFSIYIRFKSDSSGTLLETGDAHGGHPIELTVNQDSVNFDWSFLVFKNGGLSVESVSVSGSPAINTRHDWVDAVVNFSNSKVSLFLNGVLAASKKTTFSDGGMYDGFYIAASQGSFPDYFFKGKIGEVRFYDRPLKDKEINYLLNHKKIQ
jgi:hypothetical protein